MAITQNLQVFRMGERFVSVIEFTRDTVADDVAAQLVIQRALDALAGGRDRLACEDGR